MGIKKIVSTLKQSKSQNSNCKHSNPRNMINNFEKDSKIDLALKNLGINPKEIKLSLSGDILENGQVGNYYIFANEDFLLVITERKINKLSQAGNGEQLDYRKFLFNPNLYSQDEIVTYKLYDISDMRIEKTVSTYQIVAIINNQPVVLCTFYPNKNKKEEFEDFIFNIGLLKKHKNIPTKKENTENPNQGNKNSKRTEKRAERKAKKEEYSKYIKTFTRVLSLSKRFYKSLILVIIFTLWGIGINAILPYINGTVLYDQVLSVDGQYYGSILAFVISLLTITIVTAIMAVLQTVLYANISIKIVNYLKINVYKAIQKRALSFFDRSDTGALVENLRADTGSLQGFIQFGILNFCLNIIMIIAVLSIMLLMSWKLTIVVVLPILTFFYVNKKLLPLQWNFYAQVYKKESTLISIINNSLGGLRLIRAFGRSEKESKTFARANNDLLAVNYRKDMVQEIVYYFTTLIIGIGSLLIWIYGGILVVNQEITYGFLISFTTYAVLLNNYINTIKDIPNQFVEAMSAAQRLFNLMDAKPEIIEKENPISMPNIKGEIQLKNVSFGYEKDRNVLDGIDLNIKPGQMIGIAGKTGAGKTTLINIISRLYDPTSGEVMLDGVNIKDIKIADLRKNISIVLQDTFLFKGSVRDNIAFAKEDATEEEIIRAAKIANAHDFIMDLPDGYDTVVGSSGRTLSGGQRQRIAIARVVLLDPKILILDEATASLDIKTEKSIQEALERLIEGRTTILIAHKLYTLKNADRFVILERGKIIESDNYDEFIDVMQEEVFGVS